MHTVSIAAQLLTRSEAGTTLVEAVTRLILDGSFQKANHLRELFVEGSDYARRKPELPLHRGALTVYDPELRPLVNPDFVESTEGIRSFLVSLGFAVFLLYRWLRQRRQRYEEHQLDRYLRALLDIERRQVDLDTHSDRDEMNELQALLDEVTALRQEALESISVNQLNEDPCVDSFIEACHALSNKINAKISRQRLTAVLRELRDALQESRPSEH